MNSQPSVYSKNIPKFTNYSVNLEFTKVMRKPFGESLKAKMEEVGIKAAELARRSGVTKQNIGKIVNHTLHSQSGAPPKPEEITIEKLAKALNWNLNEARLAAGFAPIEDSADSHNILEGVTIQFDRSVKITKQGQEKILDVVKIVAAGIKAEEEKDNELSSQGEN